MKSYLSPRRLVMRLVWGLCGLALLAGPGRLLASDYSGLVIAGGLPVPGATVTLTEDGKKFVTVTDTQGFYSFTALADGGASVEVEMSGYGRLKQDVTITPQNVTGKLELKLLTLDEMRAALKPVLSAPFTAAQTRSEPKKTAEAPKPPPGVQAATAAPPADETAQRATDGLLINGSVNNAASSQFALAPRFGNTASGKSLYTYLFNLRLDTSALDAKSYSLTGIDTSKPYTDQITGGFAIQGPIKIPHLLRNGPNLFVGYQRTQNSVATTTPGLMPTVAERGGDLSALSQTIYAPATGLSAACVAAGVTAGAAFAGNVIPAACISSSAQVLLGLYPLPLPNLTSALGYNYQVPLVTDTHADGVNSNVNKTVGRDNQISGNFVAMSTRSSSTSLFNFVDPTSSLGMNTSINWAHTVNRRLHTSLGYQFSRQSNRVTPYFENRENVSGQAGITGNDQDPAYWGPPALSFSSGVTGLADGQQSFTRNETNGVSLRVVWNRTPHNITGGFDFRRQEFNYLNQANPRGTFGFTGAATAGGAVGGGSDLADFLLGIPDTSTIAFGNADKYLRQSVYDAYVTDDWRVTPQLTVNVGLRWEYGAPVTEIKGRLVNLDVATGFTAVAPVLGSAPVGSLTGEAYPSALLRPDRAGIEPRIGMSWRPIPGSSLLLGAGYGMNYDTSVYQGIAIQMAQQAPLSKSLTVENSAACPLSLVNGFTGCATTTADTFGVDPNFRVGYVHTWKLTAQKDLPGSLQVLLTYLGNKGTRGAQEFLPNTNPAGAANPCPSCPSGFEYLASTGNSTREGGQLQLRRRLHNGFTASALYTYSKSIDDDSSLGGQGAATSGSATIAQDWRNLRGERGLSTFDQRNLLNLTVQYTTGMGLHAGTLLSGWRGRLYKEWTVLTQVNVGSGLPETPIDSTVAVAGYSAFVRPNVTGAPLYAAPPGLFLNPAAYTTPAAGQWGDARRDSITGPSQFSMTASMLRTFRVKEKYTLDLSLAATNPLNHVTYSSWRTATTSTQFGLPAATTGMRDINSSLRVRF